jgi:hypothetical protein
MLYSWSFLDAEFCTVRFDAWKIELNGFGQCGWTSSDKRTNGAFNTAIVMEIVGRAIEWTWLFWLQKAVHNEKVIIYWQSWASMLCVQGGAMPISIQHRRRLSMKLLNRQWWNVSTTPLGIIMRAFPLQQINPTSPTNLKGGELHRMPWLGYWWSHIYKSARNRSHMKQCVPPKSDTRKDLSVIRNRNINRTTAKQKPPLIS